MTAFVADASVALAWHFEDERATATTALLRRSVVDGIVVPRHWFAEVSNGLLVGERRGRSEAANSVGFIAMLLDRMIEIDELDDADMFTRILPLARAHRLTVYDAIYLELAGRRGLPLATLDSQLTDAARGVGIEILGQED